MQPFEPRHADLVSLWEDSRTRFADRPLFGTKRHGTWWWLSYGEFDRLVDQCRGGLAHRGIGSGDRVAVISSNRVEWAAAAYASYGLGATWVPMYEAQREQDWRHILTDSGAKLLFVSTRQIAERARALLPLLPALEHLVCFEDFAGGKESWPVLLSEGARHPQPSARPGPESLAAFIYTAGTTGRPKGVMLTHRNVVGNVEAGLLVFPLNTRHRSLSFLPWAHAFGHTTELHTLIGAGASMALAESIPKISDNLAEVRPSVLMAVPSIFNGLHAKVTRQMTEKPRPLRWLFEQGMQARSKQRRGQPLSRRERTLLSAAKRVVFSRIVARLGGRLQFAICGGAALAPEVAEFVDNLGIMVCEGYGLSETSPVVSGNTPLVRRPGTVGMPLPGVRVEIDLAAGHEEGMGEIIVHGHNVMRGYHDLAAENARVFTDDGGLRTGDLGRLDEDGFLQVTGRIKEFYKLQNGRYVDPALLERRLQLSPLIHQACVFGDNRAFNVAVLVPDWSALQAWVTERGVTNTAPGALAVMPLVRARLTEELRELSQDWARYETIRAFVLATEPFSVENDQLTPKLSLKRRNIRSHYEAQLERLYERIEPQRGVTRGPPPPETPAPV